jgi:hypothetical protein
VLEVLAGQLRHVTILRSGLGAVEQVSWVSLTRWPGPARFRACPLP